MMVKLIAGGIAGYTAVWLISVTGALLLVAAISSRYAGRVPRCRRCKKDLAGRWPETSWCPGCGKRLRVPRAGRLSRTSVICAMVAIMLMSIAPQVELLGKPAAQLASHPSTQWIKPTAWVLHDFTQGEPRARTLAEAELDQRIYSDRISHSQAQALVGHLLGESTDMHPRWVEQLRRRGLIGNGLWREFVSRATTFSTNPQFFAVAGRGESIPVQVVSQLDADSTLPIEITVQSITVAGKPIRKTNQAKRQFIVSGHADNSAVPQPRLQSAITPGSFALAAATSFNQFGDVEHESAQSVKQVAATSHLRSDQLEALNLAPRTKHPVALIADVAIYDPLLDDPFAHEPLATRSIELHTQLHWLSNERVTASRDADTGSKLQDGMSIKVRRLQNDRGTTVAIVNLTAHDLPKDFFADVQLRINGLVYSAGYVTATNNEFAMPTRNLPPVRTCAALLEVPELPDEVDIIISCKPIPRSSVYVSDIWAGDIVYKAVPVEDVSPHLLRTAATQNQGVQMPVGGPRG